MKPFDPYRLDRRLMRAAAKETRALQAAGFAPYRAALEKDFAAFVGRRFCLLTDSGRTALRLAALALRPGGGTAAFPDITHPSLAEAAEGFRLLPLDIDRRTLNLSADALEAAAPGLDLLLLPHMFATPAPVADALRLARRHGFAVIEDASQILGGALRGKKFGSFGDISVLSLSPYKPVSSPFARAGALLCDSPELFRKVLALNPPPPKPQALPFLKLKLERLPATLKSSRTANAFYRAALKGHPGVVPGGLSQDAQEFPLLLPDRAGAEELFKAAGVPLERPYRPLRLEKGLPGVLPTADEYWRGAVHLPAWPEMTAAECRRAAALVNRHLAGAQKLPAPAKKLPPPSYIALDLTYRCGLDCSFCFVKRHGLGGGRELDLAGWLRAIKKLGPGAKKFYLTGGEPLLVPFLPKLIMKLKEMGHSSLVTTALFAPAARAAALAAAGPSEIVVSVHGWPALHESSAGARGAWRTALRNLELIKARRQPGTRLTLWCTVNSSNHAGLYRAYRALKALGPDGIAFNHLEFTTERDLAATRALLAGSGFETPMKASAAPTAGIDPKKLSAQIARIRASAGPSVSFYPDLSGQALRAWYSTRSNFKKPGFCRGQFSAAWLSPSGELLSCQPLAVTLGAPGAYNGPSYASFRRLLLKSGGFLPACRRCGREPYSSAGAR
ncbi:MAG: DegT/DnrJ/EryC1/StrS family aminotransferase [Elusimicrobiales bacterium]|nr:DegT/DnrJ/EryC1/StrS family aminotransferase [Elusimicrobiales bacterium]